MSTREAIELAIDKANEPVEDKNDTIEPLQWDIGKAQENLDYTRSEIDDLIEERENYQPDSDNEDDWAMFEDDMVANIEDIEVAGVYLSASDLFQIAYREDPVAINEEFSNWADSQLTCNTTFPRQKEIDEEIASLEDDVERYENNIEELEQQIETEQEEIEALEEEITELEEELEGLEEDE